VQLIDDLLDMNRIASAKVTLDMQAVAPSSFVQAALDVVGPSAAAAGVNLSVQVEPVEPVRGDAGRLQQVAWNLLGNAIKFTPRGGTVSVSLRSEGREAIVAVADSGVGIRPDVLPHIFERFRQADGSITRRFGGLGLGLAIVRHLVEMHDGSVTARSDGEGKGACFTVRLPLLDLGVLSPVDVDREAPQAVAVENQAALVGVHVLAVDDDDDGRDLLRRVLDEAGAEVDVVQSADEALAALARRRYDLLISDIGLPDVDGYELLRRVRSLPATQGGDMTAIALTAFARPEDRERALAAGFARHFSKPFAPSTIVAAAAALLARERTTGERS
jgi:CheY-like chemotaxis protein